MDRVLQYRARDLQEVGVAGVIALGRDAVKESGRSSSYANREQRGPEASMYVHHRWR